MNVEATGHMNPTLPLVKELRSRGCTVSYFVAAAMRDTVESVGATWYLYPNEKHMEAQVTLGDVPITKDIAEKTASKQQKPLPTCFAKAPGALEKQDSTEATHRAVLPALLHDLRNLRPKPAVIVYDPFIAFARVAAHVLHVPAVSFLTIPGPGALTRPAALIQALESKPSIQGPRQEILKQYGFDLFKEGLLQEFYSPTLNLVTTIDELYAHPPAGLQAERYGHFPFKCVGSQIDLNINRVQNAQVEMDASLSVECDYSSVLAEIDQAISCGRKLVYLSMGTVATANFWSSPFGPAGTANGLETCTGKIIIQHVFRACFEAMAENESIVVVVATGPKDDVLDGMPETPSNFILCRAVPQLEILKRSSAFITHGGANSMHEALSLAVPMAVVPLFGDQPVNAESIVRCGAGLAFHKPLSSVTCTAIRSVIEELLQPPEQNSFREAAAVMSAKLNAAGGVPAAVDAIIGSAISFAKENVLDGQGKVRTMVKEIEDKVVVDRPSGKVRTMVQEIQDKAVLDGPIDNSCRKLRGGVRASRCPGKVQELSGGKKGSGDARLPQPHDWAQSLHQPACPRMDRVPSQAQSSPLLGCPVAPGSIPPSRSPGAVDPVARSDLVASAARFGQVAPADRLGQVASTSHLHKWTKRQIFLVFSGKQIAARSFQMANFPACAA